MDDLPTSAQRSLTRERRILGVQAVRGLSAQRSALAIL